jgi:hypothetical protein
MSVVPNMVKKFDIHFIQMGNATKFLSPEPVAWNIYDMDGRKVASAYGREFLWNTESKGVFLVKARGTGIHYMKKVNVH